MKLLTPGEVKAIRKFRCIYGDKEIYTVAEMMNRAFATIVAACERLAQVEPCPHCGSPELVNDNDCPECSGAGRWENWQDALRSLGGGG